MISLAGLRIEAEGEPVMQPGPDEVPTVEIPPAGRVPEQGPEPYRGLTPQDYQLALGLVVKNLSRAVDNLEHFLKNIWDATGPDEIESFTDTRRTDLLGTLNSRIVELKVSIDDLRELTQGKSKLRLAKKDSDLESFGLLDEDFILEEGEEIL